MFTLDILNDPPDWVKVEVVPVKFQVFTLAPELEVVNVPAVIIKLPAKLIVVTLFVPVDLQKSNVPPLIFRSPLILSVAAANKFPLFNTTEPVLVAAISKVPPV